MRDLLFMTSNCNANIQNNTLTENRVSGSVCYFHWKSTIQLNNVATRHSLTATLLILTPTSTAIFQNNALTENYVSWTVYLLYLNSTV